MTKRRILALLLVAIAVLSLLSGCKAKSKPDDTILVIGVDAAFDEKWNPFLAETVYDHQVVDQVFVPIMQINAKNEIVPYGGDIKTEQLDGGYVQYTITVKKGMKFTDGKPVTIDDYIYGIYVRADPSYTGPGSALGSFIDGIAEYFYDTPDYTAKIAAIEEEAAEKYSAANITWEDFFIYAEATALNGWWEGDPAGDIGNGWTWSEYAEKMGYGDDLAAIDATNADQMFELIARIDYETAAAEYDTVTWFTEKNKQDFAVGNLDDGIDVAEISGVKRVDDYTCTILYTKIDIYGDRGLTVQNGYGKLIPKHYYGDFTKGDVSDILANREPMGSGPYIFQEFKDNIATCVANENFFLGVPKTGTVRWQRITQSEVIPMLANGDIDIANPTGSKDNVEEMRNLGVEFDLIDNAGYGYMGMNTNRLPDVNVRRGIWSLMNRHTSVESFYGPDIAKVIERPMTTTLAEYPQDATEMYPYDPAKALEYFQTAGYTQKDGKLVDSSGKQLVINVYIGGEGKGSHPAYLMLTQAAEDMAALGGEIQIQDVEFAVLNAAMNDGTADIWIMAWASVFDCDKREQFHSLGGQNRYRFGNDELDAILDEIPQTLDLEERREKVAKMLDLAMEFCLEYPLYQRKNILAYNADNVDMSTIPETTASYDYNGELWKVAIKGA